MYVLTLLVAALLWRTPYLALACLLATSTLLLQATRWRYTKVFFFCAVVGSISEIVAIATGAWQYANPQLLGIPIWLPLVWGSAAVLFIQLSEQLSGSKRHARSMKKMPARTRRKQLVAKHIR